MMDSITFSDFLFICLTSLWLSELLDIGSNGFTGALPEELYELTNLVSLNVSDTNIRGEISSGIGAMSNLFHLYAGSTGVGGSLPTQFFSLNQLQKLDLSVANFTGTLSESFSNLTNLDLIKLDHNRFNGTIPLGLENLPFLGTFFREESIFLHRNCNADSHSYRLYFCHAFRNFGIR